MPSPFPGMDPYLEAPAIWPDFHEALAAQLRADLNGTLPAPYYARLEMRSEVGIVENAGVPHRIVSDVEVVGSPNAIPAEHMVAVLPPQAAASPVTVTVRVDPIRHSFVEIRDPGQGHQLITLIEIVSPSNKRPGADRRAYLQKQREVLDSNASLIELDLLRSGDRLLPYPDLDEAVGRLEPAPDYLILVNRAWKRAGAAMDYDRFPIRLADPLPSILVPLREGQQEVALVLQQAFTRAYDAGPYRRGAVNYTAPPVPPLHGEDAARAELLIRESGLMPHG
jgi:hypothetical protein